MKHLLFLVCVLFSTFTFYSCDKEDDVKQTSESYGDIILSCKYIEVGDEDYVLTTPGNYTTAGDSYPSAVNYFNDSDVIVDYGIVRLEGDSIYTSEIFDISRIDVCSYKITFHKNPNEKNYHRCTLNFQSVYSGKSWSYGVVFEYVDGKWTPMVNNISDMDDAYTADSSTKVFYGRIIPYVPVAEQDVPEWLREKIHNHNKYYFRICKGTLKGKTVYHIANLMDKEGAFYDKDGNEIEIEYHTIMDYIDYISQYEDVVCIYYHRNFSNE